MALGDVITDEVQNLIASVYHAHSDNGDRWTAKEIQAEVVKQIQSDPNKYGHHPVDWPGLMIRQELPVVSATGMNCPTLANRIVSC